MIGIIGIADRIVDVKKAFSESDIWFEQIGPFDSEDFLKHCQAASAVNLLTLVVDVDCTDGRTLIKGLRMFRAERSSRILLIAPGRVPGDATITSLLSLQIWDIIAPDIHNDEAEEDESTGSYLTFLIQQQLQTESTYGNVARWDTDISFEAPRKGKQPAKQRQPSEPVQKEAAVDPSLIEFIESIELPKERVREVRIIQEQKPGQTIVAVAGINRRTGSSFAAIQCCVAFLESKKRVALVELQGNSPTSLSFFDDPDSQIKEGFTYAGIDCFPNADSDVLTHVLMHDYEAVVLDFGWLIDVQNKNDTNRLWLKEFARADVHVLTGGSSLQDEADVLLTLDFLLELNWKKTIHCLFNFVTDDSFSRINSLFKKKDKKQLQLMFYQNDLMDDPFHDQNATIEEIVGIRKRRFSLFRKG